MRDLKLSTLLKLKDFLEWGAPFEAASALMDITRSCFLDLGHNLEKFILAKEKDLAIQEVKRILDCEFNIVFA